MTQPVPQPVERAPLELWLFNRKLTLTEFARANGLTQQVLERAVLPVTHDRFQQASIKLRQKVKVITNGDIGLEDWPDAPVQLN